MSKRFTSGQHVTLTHPDYGCIRGTVHVLGNANPYIPLGFTFASIGKNLVKAGWVVTDGWADSPESRILALLDSWDTESTEATQGALVEEIRAIYRGEFGSDRAPSDSGSHQPACGIFFSKNDIEHNCRMDAGHEGAHEGIPSARKPGGSRS